jgi:amino acid adenylation domain-containing protein
MQRQFWLLWQLAPSGTAYQVPALFRLRGPLHMASLVSALEDLVSRHAVLRTTFQEKNGELLAQVHETLAPAITLGEPAVAVDAEDPSIRAIFTAPFDLRRGPLLRAHLAPAQGGGYWLALAFHHIALDLRSKELLSKDLGSLYAHHHLESPIPPPAAFDYKKIAMEEWEGSQAESSGKTVEYFAQHLSAIPAPLALPADHPRGKMPPIPGARELLSIEGELAARLRERAAAMHSKPFLLLLATWSILLARYSSTDRVAVGVPFTNRRRPGWQDAVGCFVNDLPMVVDVGGHSFDAVVAQIRNHMLGHHRHQEVPMARILERTKPPRDPSRNPIFQAGFTFEPPMSLQLSGIEVTSTKIHAGGTQLDVFMTLWENEQGQGITGQIEYATELFDAATMARLSRNFKQLLFHGLTHGPQPAVLLEWLDQTEKDQVLGGFNQTDVTWSAPDLLHELFLKQAERTPTATALSMGKDTLSYAELRQRSLALAARLEKEGVGHGDLIGIYMHRSMELPLSLLSVLVTGAAYVPIDPDYPALRVQHMLEDARPRLVLGHSATRALWPGDPSLWREVENRASEEAPSYRSTVAKPEDTAYVIFTSGSTGRPKGAANTHQGITNRILWMQEQYRLSADDVVLQKTPYGFDVSTWEFFWPLVVGARLEMAPPGVHRDPFELGQLIKRANVTTIHFVPSMLQAFLDHPEARSCSGLRRIIASGEALPTELVRRCQGTLSAPLYNLYGPTEAAVDVTAWDCTQDPERDPVPIGKPIANTRMYVLDAYLRPVPIGVPGEIFIGGVQVGTGYVNRPELTAERFLPDPFCDPKGGRLYRTGDLGRWDPDGQLTYLGRLDHQVKIRGLRIELSEIESVLDRCAGVRQSVVVAHPPGSSNAKIVAYLAIDDRPGLVENLRAHTAKSLPAYMVPQQFILLDRLPISPNGKVDRKALPSPKVAPPVEASLPEGAIETWLAGEWHRLLGGTSVGRTANVFDLGGNSVMIASLVGKVRERFGFDVPLVRFFEHPTVAGLADHLQSLSSDRPHPSGKALDEAHERALKRRAVPRPRRPA